MAKIATYLDYNATAPTRAAVQEAVSKTLEGIGNPSSIHGAGRAVRDAIEVAREKVARLVHASPDQVVFTSGGTEANHLAVQGASVQRHLISAVEHDSIRGAVIDAEIVPVDGNGIADLKVLEGMLSVDPKPALVSIMMVNNETGVIMPIADVSKIVHAHGSYLFSDAVQAAGKMTIDLGVLDIDYLTLSAHKLGGPMGVGALILGPHAPYVVPTAGSGQERGRRPGTENVPGIIGFGVAAEIAAESLEDFQKLAALRDQLEAGIRRITEEAHIFACAAPRVANTTLVSMPRVPSETQLAAFDLAGFAVSAGSACSSGKVDPSHVLLAMGVAEAVAATAIRISLGWDSRTHDVTGFLKAWESLYVRTRDRRVSAA